MGTDYTGLRWIEDREAARRCAERLLALRARLAPLRERKGEGRLLLATWNIRDFDSNRYGWGPRLDESFYYIAEILSCFDLVAVQEVNRDLDALNRVMAILGRSWDHLVTDTTEGTGGNQERMAFLWDRARVWRRNVVGEVVLPEGQLVVSRKRLETGAEAAEPEIVETRQQFARSPFLVAFQSGWFRFNLCTAHIYYGAESGFELERRIGEIDALVKFFKTRQDRENRGKTRLSALENYILLGDFNVVSPEHETMRALTRHGFVVPPEIDGDAVRGAVKHFYDQIAVRTKDTRFRVSGGGMVDIFADLFRADDSDRALYAPVVPDKDRRLTPERRFETWRSFQLSDHAPLWIEIATDYADAYLSRIRDG